MPIRPELSLQVQRPKLLGPQDVVSLQNMVQQRDLGQIQTEEARAAQDKRVKLSEIYGQAGAFDTTTGLPTAATLPKIGAVDPTLVPKFIEQRTKIEKERADLGKVQLETNLKKEQLLNETVRGPALAAYQAALPQGEEAAQRAGQIAFSEASQAAVRSGLFSLEEKSQFPLDFDPKRVQQRLMQSKDWMSIQTGERTRTETERHNKATEAQRAADAAATAAREQFGQPFEATGPDGKPKLVVQNKKTGAIVDANTKEPVSGIGPKPGEASQKQITGVETTKDAIKEYRAALKNWSASDIVNPNARAKMGTIYNNMLLQAKEAYNLGVLNGPDYMILQQVITNPASLTGGITSKSALDEQAKKLDELMGRVGQKVKTVQTGVPGGGAPEAKKNIGGKNYIKVGGKWFEE